MKKRKRLARYWDSRAQMMHEECCEYASMINNNLEQSQQKIKECLMKARKRDKPLVYHWRNSNIEKIVVCMALQDCLSVRSSTVVVVASQRKISKFEKEIKSYNSELIIELDDYYYQVGSSELYIVSPDGFAGMRSKYTYLCYGSEIPEKKYLELIKRITTTGTVVVETSMAPRRGVHPIIKEQEKAVRKGIFYRYTIDDCEVTTKKKVELLKLCGGRESSIAKRELYACC